MYGVPFSYLAITLALGIIIITHSQCSSFPPKYNECSLALQVDVTDLIEGHSSYLWATQEILDRLDLDTYYPVFRSTPDKQ
jgi:hypothetical protein